MKGRRIPLQRPPLSSPVRAGVPHVPSRPSAKRVPRLDSPVLPTPLAPTTAILTSRRPAAPRQQSAAVLPGAGYSAMVHMFWMRRIAAPAGLHSAGREVEDRRRLALQREEGTRSDAARAETRKNPRGESDETRGSAVPVRGWDGSRPGADFLWPRPRLYSISQSPAAPLDAPPTACTTRLRPHESPKRVRSPVRSAENRAAGARVATCGNQPAPAALARGRTGGCGATGSQIRVGDLSVSAGSQVRVGGICPCLRGRLVSAGSQIRGGLRSTLPCLPTSLLGLHKSVPRHSPYWVPGPLTSLTTAYIRLSSPSLTQGTCWGTPQAPDLFGPVLCSTPALETPLHWLGHIPSIFLHYTISHHYIHKQRDNPPWPKMWRCLGGKIPILL